MAATMAAHLVDQVDRPTDRPTDNGCRSSPGFSLAKCPVGNNFAGSPAFQHTKIFLCGALDADYPMGYYDNNTGERR